MLDDRQRGALTRELVARGGAWITCAGASMEPTVRRGERVFVRPAERARAGDVVLFETADGEAFVLHRVIAKVPGTGWYLHVGDGGSGDGAGLFHRRQLVGLADLPRRRPGPRLLLAGARRTVRAARNLVRRYGSPRTPPPR